MKCNIHLLPQFMKMIRPSKFKNHFVDSSPIPSRWMTNGNMSPNNDTLNKIHADNEDQTSKSTPMSIENPYPPPRKERSAEPSRHSSGKNNSGDSESNGTLSSQANSSGATSNSKSEGSSSHTYANPLRFLYL